MSLQRLYGRLTRLEAQRRPWVVADTLRRARQCAPDEAHEILLDALTTVDMETARAIGSQLTDAESDALIPPEMQAVIETLSESELEALARGDPAATRRVQRALRALQHRGDVCA